GVVRRVDPGSEDELDRAFDPAAPPAAVLLELVLAPGGMIPLAPATVAAIPQRARAVVALVIVDEVMTFRLGRGGLHGRIGVEPDLCTLGKVLGGGLPL